MPPRLSAVELAAHGGGDRLAEDGLAHAGRADEAQDGPLDVGLHLAHGQVLEDALLHLLQVVVVVVEDLLGLDDVDLGLGALAPGQRHQPVEVGAGHGVLGRGRRHLGEAVQLAQGLLLGVLGHAGRLDLLAQLVELALLVVALAQLLLDGLHLLAQVVLALVLLQLGLHLALDLVADLQHLQVLDQHLVEPLQARLHVERLQHLLLLRRWSARAGWRRRSRPGAPGPGCWRPASAARRRGWGRAPPRAGRGPARSGPGRAPRSPAPAGRASLQQLDAGLEERPVLRDLRAGGSAARPARPGAASRRGT